MLNTMSELGRKRHPHDTSRVLTTHGDLSPSPARYVERTTFSPLPQSQGN